MSPKSSGTTDEDMTVFEKQDHENVSAAEDTTRKRASEDDDKPSASHLARKQRDDEITALSAPKREDADHTSPLGITEEPEDAEVISGQRTGSSLRTESTPAAAISTAGQQHVSRPSLVEEDSEESQRMLSQWKQAGRPRCPKCSKCHPPPCNPIVRMEKHAGNHRTSAPKKRKASEMDGGDRSGEGAKDDNERPVQSEPKHKRRGSPLCTECGNKHYGKCRLPCCDRCTIRHFFSQSCAKGVAVLAGKLCRFGETFIHGSSHIVPFPETATGNLKLAFQMRSQAALGDKLVEFGRAIIPGSFPTRPFPETAFGHLKPEFQMRSQVDNMPIFEFLLDLVLMGRFEERTRPCTCGHRTCVIGHGQRTHM